MSEQKKERKMIKAGTHGNTIGAKNKPTMPYGTGNPELVKPKVTLREADPNEWKARKLRKVGQKTKVCRAAKSNGHRMGRFVGGGACCKRTDCDAIIRFAGLPESEKRNGAENVCNGQKTK